MFLFKWDSRFSKLFLSEALIRKGCIMRLKGVGLLAPGLKKQSFINFGIHAAVTYTTWVQYSLVMSGSYIFVTYLEAYLTLKLCKICFFFSVPLLQSPY